MISAGASGAGFVASVNALGLRPAPGRFPPRFDFKLAKRAETGAILSTMRIAIVGSRRRSDRETIASFIRALPAGAVIVSGGCEGPDKFAAEAARDCGLAVVEHLPNLSGCVARFEFTKRFYERNQRVVNDCDRLVAAVAADRKGGAEDTIRRAKKAGKPVTLI
ncbi:MAG: hypothetical protein WAN43_16380 [Rhodomicrobium sp.]